MYDYVFCIYDKGKNDKKVGYLHMNIYCNPINFGYRYQFNGTPEGGVTASREAADPSMYKLFVWELWRPSFLSSRKTPVQ